MSASNLLFPKKGSLKELARFTSSGNWLCPAGITEILILACGGGGGGGARDPGGNSGVGGNGSRPQWAAISVTPGVSYPITIGAGGVGNLSNDPGTNGGDTTAFGFTFQGGLGGRASTFLVSGIDRAAQVYGGNGVSGNVTDPGNVYRYAESTIWASGGAETTALANGGGGGGAGFGPGGAGAGDTVVAQPGGIGAGGGGGKDGIGGIANGEFGANGGSGILIIYSSSIDFT